MIWSKMKQQLEGFICPELVGRVEYRATSYRYMPDKPGRCYITVDKKEVFNMSDSIAMIKWYKTEQEVKSDIEADIKVSDEEIEEVRKSSNGSIPEERLRVIAQNRKISMYSKEIIAAQAILSKSDFNKAATDFLSGSLEKCLESKDVMQNIFALIDRRLGKKRLLAMKETIKLKHPIVQYFYELRLSVM